MLWFCKDCKVILCHLSLNWFSSFCRQMWSRIHSIFSLIYRNTGGLGLVIFLIHLRNLFWSAAEMDFCFNYFLQCDNGYSKLINAFINQLFGYFFSPVIILCFLDNTWWKYGLKWTFFLRLNIGQLFCTIVGILCWVLSALVQQKHLVIWQNLQTSVSPASELSPHLPYDLAFLGRLTQIP